MSLSPRPSLSLALLLYVSAAVAQSNLGELLDSGAKKLSPEQFKDEIVQRIVVGPSPTGVTFEVMYAESGNIAGTSGSNVVGVNRIFPVSGAWSLDDSGRVCSEFNLFTFTGPNQGTLLPKRCQSWFKLSGVYFVADSDSDRQARVLRRTLKENAKEPRDPAREPQAPKQ